MNNNNNTPNTSSGTPAKTVQTVQDILNMASSQRHIELSYEEWLQVFRPIQNPYRPRASFDGRLFDTQGTEFAFVHEQKLGHIWVMEEICDHECVIHSSPFSYGVSGFFVTEIPHLANRDIIITIKPHGCGGLHHYKYTCAMANDDLTEG